MKAIHLYSSDTTQDPKNVLYAHEFVVADEESLKQAVSHDYTAVCFKGGKRAIANFEAADCIILDVDNTHSENPDEWITPEGIARMFPTVEYAVHYSRNHLREKNGMPARAKYHLILPTAEMTTPEQYSDLCQRIYRSYPFIDANALDAGRFFFGTEDPKVEIHEGTQLITDLFPLSAQNTATIAPATPPGNIIPQAVPNTAAPTPAAPPGNIIPQGQRNTTMHTIAVQLLTKYGNCIKARTIFDAQAQRCTPPLEPKELDSIWTSACGFYNNTVSQNPSYIPPAVYNHRYVFRPKDYSDIGQARQFVKQNGDKIRYCPPIGWLCYDGIKWVPSELDVQDKFQKFSGWQLAEALNAVEYNHNGADIYLAHARKYRSSAAGAAVTKEARPMCRIDADMLDMNPYLLNTPSATYDLRQGMSGKQDHKGEDMITKVTAVDPSDEGMSIWLDTLDTYFCGDAALIEYVQLIIGTAAIGEVKVECLYLAVGSGRNGKSSFWNAIATVLGTYAGHVDSDVLLVTNKNVDAEKAELRGKRLVVAAELEEDAVLSSKMLKNLTSTDIITARRLYHEPEVFKPSHTLVVFSNHLPVINERDNGTWRRIAVLPFNAVIQLQNDITNYGDYLVKVAGESILKWIIEGAKKAIDADFKIPIPAAVKAITDAYRGNSDWLERFILSFCEVGVNFECKAYELYNCYRSYCNLVGESEKSNKAFSVAILADGRFERKKTNQGNLYKGLRLK